ncbi:tripartite tricarboxylate transporter family receptor [Variibacter gotjawalensis]|uniref:Tripartite tricarboxylate transporter family receptor n=1 Tax=Variibacter gotjawalensis TaxID=1333996 RepID=A0A0S3PX29_9BRAD|nr:tripartite tricarboxylate transporter substrate-binding protein [Variibacter gotjawalensis]NIK46323.1 tripartite-type tricarboxylate transporter receptor subunit TctC [Variibacter gotjawalensis]RZS48233.1 tripartite-type tricarboxylate transporter receptor subunit TctC [Variibacter gotjawalensis]BAT60493.1 tripartite tricarboxylate transporter family receptor [Variibacter gotjawalensis]
MVVTRRLLLQSAPCFAFATRAHGQAAWSPSQPVRLVVPYAAGGPTDAVARIVADRLSATLPIRAIVENRAGGGALIGTEAVARAPADGGTLLFTTVVHAVHRALRGDKLSFDPEKDFAAVALIGVVPQVIMVPADSPVRDLAGLIDNLRAGPRTYGSSGTGGSSHLGVELLTKMTGTRAEHIPYRGTGPAMIDLLAGRIAFMMDSVVTGAAQVKAGSVRGIATTGRTRSAVLPDLPTVGETLPGYEATTWNAILAPAATTPTLVEAMNASIWKAIGDEATPTKLSELGVQLPAAGERSAQAAQRFVAAETAKWGALIRDAKIVAE